MKRDCPRCGREVPVIPGLKNFRVAHYGGRSPSGIIMTCKPSVEIIPSEGRDLPAGRSLEIWEDDSLWEDL